MCLEIMSGYDDWHGEEVWKDIRIYYYKMSQTVRVELLSHFVVICNEILALQKPINLLIAIAVLVSVISQLSRLILLKL